MIFCKVCGEALNLFETRDEEVCYACLRKDIKQVKPAPVPETGTMDFLSAALLAHEDDKLVVRSPEGWSCGALRTAKHTTWERSWPDPGESMRYEKSDRNKRGMRRSAWRLSLPAFSGRRNSVGLVHPGRQMPSRWAGTGL
jgi:hypothetical protein